MNRSGSVNREIYKSSIIAGGCTTMLHFTEVIMAWRLRNLWPISRKGFFIACSLQKVAPFFRLLQVLQMCSYLGKRFLLKIHFPKIVSFVKLTVWHWPVYSTREEEMWTGLLIKVKVRFQNGKEERRKKKDTLHRHLNQKI